VRRQDLSVLALHCLGFTTVRNALLRRFGGPLTRFVTYHDIPETDAENFSAMLRYLKRTSNVISLDDFFDGNLSKTRTNVVITFDDGYLTWKTVAMPLLTRFALPATFFVSSGLVASARPERRGGAAARIGAAPAAGNVLTEDDVRELAQSGFTIGGHTLDHVSLGATDDEAELARQIAADRVRLQSITRSDIRYFAYPFGVCRNTKVDLVSLLRQAGYRGAVTTIPGRNSATTNPYLLHRELTGVPMPIPVFAARVNGAYDGVRSLRAFARMPSARRAFGA
jgi:peptidoglycan/xylan/chitin deacetylase (PgdA/CDA1 family)